MTRPKARYVGDGAGVIVPWLPEALKTELRRLLPHEHSAADVGEHRDFAKAFGSSDWRDAEPTDGMVGALMSAAYQAKVRLHESRRISVSKEELSAEFADLARSLEQLQSKLRSISPPLSRLLPVEADPLGVADQIEQFGMQLQQSSSRVARSGSKKRDAEVASELAKQLSLDVIRILEADGLPTGCTVSEEDTPSLLIALLGTLGGAAGLRRAAHTWKKDALAAKASNAAPRRRKG